MPRTTYQRSPSALAAAEADAPIIAANADAWGGWRPRGWSCKALKAAQGPEAGWSIADVLLEAEKAKAGGKTRARSALELEVMANEKLLRDCYNTPAWVPAVTAIVAGITSWHCDSFYNPTAPGMLARCKVKLDGSDDANNGLAVDEEGRPLNWRGSTFANGPHSNPRPWVRAADRHGQEHIAAALVQQNGAGWYYQEGIKADLEICLGRLPYCAPPGLPPRQAPPLGSAVLLWVPRMRESIRAGEFEPYAINVNTGARRRHLVIVRQATAGRSLCPEDPAKLAAYDAENDKKIAGLLQ